MREQVRTSLKALKSELEGGEAKLAKVGNHRTYLRETMLQISGAVQVMEELLAEVQPTEQRDGTNRGETRSERTGTRSTGIRTDENKQAS
jgi:hypothetical protein